ncbi:FAD-dependent oxidoreductase [Actinotalea subterranea]|uniref:FAD-dependent oxidoreductase n=1 Tax=Actinotalea subterranea TaxID=2607497 RepID=UPI001FE7E363|nr:FAD-dependent oxidoreductase [Actinotalea subterranea]
MSGSEAAVLTALPTPAPRPVSPARRLVVVGHGMVGSRLVEDLLARAPGAYAVTVLGEEPYEPYNRVLLSEVVAGVVDVASLTLPSVPAGAPGTASVDVRRGTCAVAIDRERRVVVADDGGTHPYDVLVLATGSRARVPAITGLTAPEDRRDRDVATDGAGAPPRPGLPAGVHALRTLDDAREIVAAAVNAHAAVVLGGGVLGIEAAAGLAGRGVRVTVVHGGPHLMDRQLGPEAAAAAERALDRLGVGLRTGATAREVVLEDGHVRALRLGCGTVVPADLLVLTAGTVPAAELAAACGLEVRRGVVVGPDLATRDPAVHAIGDCAEPPEGATGLIAQGWEQARRLATRLARQAVPPERAPGPAEARTAAEPTVAPDAGPSAGAAASEPPPPTDVVRLKARGVEVVAMGRVGSPPDARAGSVEDRPATVPGREALPAAAPTAPAYRTVRLSDPDAGRHVEVTVAGGVLVGVTCVGAGPVAADLVAAYTRRTPVPDDPAHLLLRPPRGAASATAEPSPMLMPDRTTVCRCNGVTKGDLVATWRSGGRSVEDMAASTRATTGCGGCTEAVCGILEWLGRTDPPTAAGAGVTSGAATTPGAGAGAGAGTAHDPDPGQTSHVLAVRTR